MYIIGEDILDPYGGSFKVTKGISTAYPDRVIATPISEAGIIGFGTGLAIEGFFPVVEIMFGDFLTLGFDQIMNSAAKFHKMYNNKIRVPLTIRTPMGGGRGYGPTHSQSLESFFLGIPGFKVFNLNVFQDIEPTLEYIVFKDYNPKLIIEHKLDYSQNLVTDSDFINNGFLVEKALANPTQNMSISMIEKEYCDCTVLTYGHTALLAKEIIMELMIDMEITCHLIVPTQLYPFDYKILMESVNNTGRLIILEEGWHSYGFGSEIAATMQKLCFGKLKSPITRVASENEIIPASLDGEKRVLINRSKIKKAIITVIEYLK